MKNLIFITFLLINSFISVYACDQKPNNYQPILETDKFSDETLLTKLFIPKHVGDDELVAILFHIGDSKSFSLPIAFYDEGEIDLLHKEGYGSVVFNATLDKLKEITVEARYQYPPGLNVKMELCTHSESFNLSGLL